MKKILNWLLEGKQWVQYRTRVDLLGEDENDPAVIAARMAMINYPQIVFSG